jgi:hypothetical protein
MPPTSGGVKCSALGSGQHLVGAGHVGEELPVAAADRLEDAPERGLVAQLGGEVERRVQRDPDGRLEEHGQAAQGARGVDALLLPELGHLLLLALRVVLVLLADLLLHRRDRLHLLAEAEQADLAPPRDRVQRRAHHEHEQDDRERPVARQRVGEAEDRHQDVGEPGEGAHLAAGAAEVVDDEPVEVERFEQRVRGEVLLEQRARVDARRRVARAARGDGLGRVVQAHDHDGAVGVLLAQVGVEHEAVDLLDALEDLAVAPGAHARRVEERVERDGEVAPREGGPDEAAALLGALGRGPERGLGGPAVVARVVGVAVAQDLGPPVRSRSAVTKSLPAWASGFWR